MQTTSNANFIDGPIPVNYLASATPGEAAALGTHSVPAMLGLTLLTLTAYMPYWLYTRSQALRRLGSVGIPQALVHGALAAYALAFLCNLGQLITPYSEAQRLLLAALALTANSGLLVWVLLLRQRLIEDVFHQHPRPKVNPVLTVFFSIFYLQSLLNRAQAPD